MNALVRFIYFISVVFFLFNLFFGYYQFPEFVPIGYSDNVELKEYKSKSTLFYAGGGAFLVFNILIILMRRVVHFTPFSVLPLPNKKFWLQSAEARESLVKIHVGWLDSFASIFNVFLGSLFLFLFLINVGELAGFDAFVPYVYAGMLVLSLWWVILPARLSYKKLEL